MPERLVIKLVIALLWTFWHRSDIDKDSCTTGAVKRAVLEFILGMILVMAALQFAYQDVIPVLAAQLTARIMTYSNACPLQSALPRKYFTVEMECWSSDHGAG